MNMYTTNYILLQESSPIVKGLRYCISLVSREYLNPLFHRFVAKCENLKLPAQIFCNNFIKFIIVRKIQARF